MPTGMRGPTCIVWANLTPFSLQVSVFTCPHAEACVGNSTHSIQDDQICRDGATGPLCAFCRPGYGRLSKQSACRPCSENVISSSFATALLAAAAGGGLLVFLATFLRWMRLRKRVGVLDSSLVDHGEPTGMWQQSAERLENPLSGALTNFDAAEELHCSPGGEVTFTRPVYFL